MRCPVAFLYPFVLWEIESTKSTGLSAMIKTLQQKKPVGYQPELQFVQAAELQKKKTNVPENDLTNQEISSAIIKPQQTNKAFGGEDSDLEKRIHLM